MRMLMELKRIASGSTPSGSTSWFAYGAYGIYVDVDTSAGEFPFTPVYVTSLGGSSNHWLTTGVAAIYSATPKSFRVYVRWLDGGRLTPAQATSLMSLK